MKTKIIGLVACLGFLIMFPKISEGITASGINPAQNDSPKHSVNILPLFPNGVLGPDGALGKNGIVAVNNLTDTLSKDVNRIQKQLFSYLKDSLNITINKTIIGLLDSALVSFGDPKRMKGLDSLLDGLIKHSVGTTRKELIAFKNGLLDKDFRNELDNTLDIIMNDVIEKPSARLVDIITGDNTRMHLDNLLRMIVPAILNDSALGKVDHLRNSLLGNDMKKGLNSVLDTALGTLNSRLKHDIIPTINNGLQTDANVLTQKGKDIISYIVIGIIIVALVLFFLHKSILKKKNDLLFTVSNTIEEFREEDQTPGQEIFHSLTDKIRKNMVRAQLENDMKNFLIKKSINKPEDYIK